MTARAPALASGKTGMTVFVISDGFAFAALLFAYAMLRAAGATYAPGAPAPGVGLAALLTVLLLGSSAALALAIRAEGTRRALLCAAAAGLGLLFFAGQLVEWSGLVAGGLRLGDSQRGSIFYVLTGYHGLHVLLGALALAALAARRAGRRSLETAAIYWHFVDAVWLFLFAGLYLI